MCGLSRFSRHSPPFPAARADRAKLTRRFSHCLPPSPLSFQQLTSIKSPISPLNPVFLPFIAFLVRNERRLHRIRVTHSTHRNF